MPSNAHYVESLPPSPTIENTVKTSMCPQCYHHIDTTSPPSTSFLCCVFWRSSEIPWKCTECGYMPKPTQASDNTDKVADSGYHTPAIDESSQHTTMHAPAPAWVARTGWTPQPDINVVINRGFCTNCDSYVKKEGENCSQCGIPLTMK